MHFLVIQPNLWWVEKINGDQYLDKLWVGLVKPCIVMSHKLHSWWLVNEIATCQKLQVYDFHSLTAAEI